MRRYLAMLFFCAIFFDTHSNSTGPLSQLFQKGSAKSKPNVLVIITDDQGYGDMSCHGNPWLKTPNIDQLYRASTRLQDFHVSPTCAPTRAALLTGHYSNRTGVWHTIGGRSLLRKSEMTMAEIFAANGYATGIFGKWHLGDNFPFRPQDRGFQEVLVHGGGGVGQGPDYWNNDYFDDYYFHNGKPEKFSGYCTDVWFEHALEFIATNKEEEKPFFCYLSTNAPHSPYYVKKDYVAPYVNNDDIAVPAFNGMVSNIDENLGKLLHYLKVNELEDNTLLIFMTDNGTAGGVRFNEGEIVKGYNAGMRGQKGSMYEGGHRVPCFIRWPAGNIMAGKDITDVTAHVDLLPTMVDMLKLQVPGRIAFDGISLKDVLLGEEDHLPIRTLITDSQRLEQPEKWRQSATMKGKWRLINGMELYNLEKDPGQQKDLATEYPEVVDQLRADYEKWWDGIKLVFDEPPAIALCPVQAPITIIRTHDMHMDETYNMVPWNHEHIKSGMKSNGWYSVHVQEDPTYKFTLMRWPPEAHAGMGETVASIPALEGTTVGLRPEGKSLKITGAGISIGEIKKQVGNSKDGLEGIIINVPLKAGNHKLRAWFTDQEGETFAAYYVKVEKD